MDTKTRMEQNNTGWRALFAGNNKYKAIALALGVMLHVTNIYISATIMPTIVREIGGLAYYAWNTTVFVMASIIGSVASARLLAIKGPRKSYRWAIILFAIGTVISMLSPQMFVLLMGRAVQGLGGGFLFALSYGMIRIIFESSLWSRAMALISGMWGIGGFVGPFIGGIFAQYGHWRPAFGITLVVCIGLLLITEFILPAEHESEAKPPLPLFKLILLLLSALAVSVGSVAEHIIYNLAGLFTGLLLIILLIVWERRGKIRLLPTGAYRLSSPLGAVYAVMVLLALIAAIEIFVPYFEQTIHGFSALEAGYLTVLIALSWTAASMIFSGLKEKYLVTITASGAVLMIGGLAGMAYLTGKDYNTTVLVATCIFLSLTGAGIGLAWPHLTVRVFSLAPPNEVELTSTSITTLQLMAMAFGAALGGLITNAGGMIDPGGVSGAKSAAYLLYALFILAPLLVIVLLMINKNLQKRLLRRG